MPKSVTHLHGPGRLSIHGNLTLEHPVTIDGNLLVVVSGSITATSDVQINAELYAGRSINLAKAKGRALIIARETIELGPASRLEAPSQAGIIGIVEMGPAPGQRLLLKGHFKGTLFTWSEPATETTYIKITNGALFSGYIFCSGKLELETPISGHVYTHEMMSSSGSRAFSNWLKDVSIDRKSDEVSWAMPPGFSKGVEVIQWTGR